MKRRIRQFLAGREVNLGVIFLVLLSVSLLLVEYFFKPTAEVLLQIELVQSIILVALGIDLILRWYVSRTTWSFLKKHWLEILALLPMFRVFRLTRIVILLRLVQLFAMGAIFRRRIGRLQHIFDSRWPEYAMMLGFTAFALIFGTLGLLEFETGAGIGTPEDAFWKALFSLLSGEYADYPDSLGGKIVVLILFVFGMGIFAMLTGTISAYMLEKLREDKMKIVENSDYLNQHIVICGNSSKAHTIIKELILQPKNSDADIVLVSSQIDAQEQKNLSLLSEQILFLPEDFTHIETLSKAGIANAKTAIILSELSQNRNSHDADARTILAALTIEKINPKIHTIAELNHAEYSSHLKMGGVDDIILQGEISGLLLSRASTCRGLLPFFENLLSSSSGNNLVFCPVDVQLIGKLYADCLNEIFKQYSGTVVGVKSPMGELKINPLQHIFQNEDQILLLVPRAI